MLTLRSSKVVNLSYHDEKKVKVKRFQTKKEIEEYEYSPHKLVDQEITAFENAVIVKLYDRREGSFKKTISGGNYDFNELIPPGVFIEIKIKHPEIQLRDHLCEITRKLNAKYLKPGRIQPGQYTTTCVIDNCGLTKEIIDNFFNDFSYEIEKR